MVTSRKPSVERPAIRRLRRSLQELRRFLLLFLLCGLCLQVWFGLRIVCMNWLNPESTAFERSEALRLLGSANGLRWRQHWVEDQQLGDPIKRAVIASEDSGFVQHEGVEWDSVEKAWAKNQVAEQRAEQITEKQAARAAAKGKEPPKPAMPKLVGGSTITQQLAKNLFLSGERTHLRKGQELILTLMLEAALDKRRILTIYLNHVEMGEGVFGMEAAAKHYYRTSAAQLQPAQAARLAVMLPAPKRFEKQPLSDYLATRAGVVLSRMPAVELP